MSGQWMTVRQVSQESGRGVSNVRRALYRGLLAGAQAHVNASWRVSRTAFEEWMARGAPIDDPRRAKLRRAS